MWRKSSQWPISWVTVRPKLNGAAALPRVPKAVFRITTPSVAGGPPGNCAYPRRPPPSVQTQIFKYLSLGHGSAPPLADDFTVSPVPNEVRVVFVRVIPEVDLPVGSVVARANWIRASATSTFQMLGTLLLSEFVYRKSLFITGIFLLI